MSKYVRVYESDYVENEYLTTYQEHCEHVANIQDNGFDFEGCIVKQADTIEDLCDEFVIVNNADRLPFRLSVSVAKELEEKDKTGNELYQGTTEPLFDLAKNKLKNLKEFVGDKEHHDEYANYLYENNPNFVFEGTIKGAIWTDKGLIYVAKMNDKGELELL